MNIYLNCPYSQKESAKQHGARWDAARKQWFFAGDALPEPLQQFSLAHNRTMTLRLRQHWARWCIPVLDAARFWPLR